MQFPCFDAFNATARRGASFHLSSPLRGWWRNEDVTVVERETPASRILSLNGESCQEPAPPHPSPLPPLCSLPLYPHFTRFFFHPSRRFFLRLPRFVFIVASHGIRFTHDRDESANSTRNRVPITPPPAKGKSTKISHGVLKKHRGKSAAV